MSLLNLAPDLGRGSSAAPRPCGVPAASSLASASVLPGPSETPLAASVPDLASEISVVDTCPPTAG